MAEAVSTAQVIARYISQSGVRYIFGYPGDPNIELMEQARREGIEFVLGRREGTAALMAEAYGQLSDHPGVCLATLGPGCTNLVNANATALLDRTPMISIGGQLSTALEPIFTHQNIDQLRLFSSVTKWTAQMVPGAAASIMRKAFRIAMAERPGPVHLITHSDILKTPATDSEVRLPPMAASAGEPQVFTTGRGTDWTTLLTHSKRPVVVTGISAVRAKAGDAIRNLAEHVGCPVIVSPKAKGVLSADHPYFAGTLDMACGPVVWKFLEGCDLILAIGFDAVELIKRWQLEVPVLHIDSTPNTDQVYPADTEVVGDIPAIINSLADAYQGGLRWSEADVKHHMDELWNVYYSGRVAGKLNPTDVIDELQQVFPHDTIVTTDVGSHKLLVGQGWPAYQPKSVLMTNGLSSMGFSLPGAITAKLLNPDRPVICFTGDGGFAMVQSELQLASSLKLGLVIVVFCDNSLNRIELKQIALKYPSYGTRLESTDLVKAAEAMGCDGAHVDRPEQLGKLLANPSRLTRPLLIEAYIDPAQYSAQF